MTFNSFRSILAGAVALTAMVGAAPAMAEIKEVTFANQTGLTHLPLMIMKDMHLVEKHLAAQGLEQTQVNWVTLPGSAAMTDGLLSGSVQVASAGFPGMALLWEKTGGRVKSLGAQSTASLRLVTRLEGVETVADLPLDTKIAVPSVGTSPQALFLKMAALKLYGPDELTRFDQMTVTMGHPDAFISMLSERSPIDSHFAAPPFDTWELAQAEGTRLILDSNEVTDGPATCTVLMATTDFRENNPVTFAAIHAALREAVDFINAEPEQSAKIYLAALNNTRDSVEDTAALISDPNMGYDVTPFNTVKLAGLMRDVAVLKNPPSDWKEMFFPEVHDLNGN